MSDSPTQYFEDPKIIKPSGVLKSSNISNAPKVINYHPNPNPKSIAASRYFGGFSFDSESLPEFSEFESDTPDSVVAPATTTKRRSEPTEGKMAPVSTIETITISRPLKVIAFICGCFAAILLIMGLASTEWLLAEKYRQGLFLYCVEKNVSSVPFVPSGDLAREGCHRIDWNIQGYTLVAAAFCAISFLVDLFATILTALGLRCRDPNKKYKYYRVAVYVMALALVSVLVALVIYPVCFSQIMEKSHRPVWEFGWAYGVAWGASIFLFGGTILLLCDKESEEIYYKERTIVYADTNNKV